MEIFDIHHHLGSLMGGSLQEGDGWEERDYENRVRIMQANGVTMAAILAATGYIQADGIKDTMRCNDTVAAYRKTRSEAFPRSLWDRRAAAWRAFAQRVRAHQARAQARRRRVA